MMAALRRAFLPETWTERVFWVMVVIPATILIWQSLDRAPPAGILLREPVNYSVVAGDTLLVHVRSVVHFYSRIVIQRTLYDGRGLRYEYGAENYPPSGDVGETVDYVVEIPIPPAASPGRGRLSTTTCWQRPRNMIHVLWPVCSTLKTLEFNIVERAK